MKREYKNELGQVHRTDGPAIEENDGTQHWIVNGKYHRIDGPAVIYPNAGEEWYINGDKHREDGPAVIEYFDNYKEWWVNGKLHREDGPAIETESKSLRMIYYLYGKAYHKDQYETELIKLKLDRLKKL